MSDSPPPRAALWTLAGLALAGALLLSWLDLLPGGWRLRGLVEPHELSEHARRERVRHGALLRFAREDAEAPEGAIVFLGSSTIARFPLARSFPGKPCLGRGIPDEPTARLAERVAASLPPRGIGGVVLFTGRVEHLAGAAPEEVAGAVARVLDALGERAPEAPVLLLGLYPEREPRPGTAERLRETNLRLRRLAAERGHDFLDTVRAPLAVGPPGEERLAPELAADRWHLGPEGYRVLARWIQAEGGAIGRSLAP